MEYVVLWHQFLLLGELGIEIGSDFGTGRHRAMSEGIVNNLMNHQGVRHASWKGLALARSQVGLAVLLLNTLKWYKIRHGQLRPMALRSAA